MPRQPTSGSFKPGQSGNPKGRPRRAEKLSREITGVARRIVELLPGATLDAHGLLRVIYQSGEFPLALRFAAAQACLPFERPRLSATVVMNARSTVADRLVSAKRRLGLDARNVIEAAFVELPGAAQELASLLGDPPPMAHEAPAAGAPQPQQPFAITDEVPGRTGCIPSTMPSPHRR